jgi:hypothetical protein
LKGQGSHFFNLHHQAESEVSMKCYIGAKIIRAEPMAEFDFLREKNPHQWRRRVSSLKLIDPKPLPNREQRPGYKVLYPDGYVSWSPQNVFEEAYRPISDKEKELI